MSTKTGTGIIIGRFQVHELHEGHKEIINYVKNMHQQIIIFLGVSSVLASKKNPLNFYTRQKMIIEEFKDILVLPLPDMASDEVWSKELDKRIQELVPKYVTLYGSRDSFLPHYKGTFKTKELQPKTFTSGTEVRKNVSKEIKTSKNFRAGIIFATYNRYDISFQTIDVAIFSTKGKGTDEDLLLCKKPNENKLRFVGGFVNPKDLSLEYTVKREVSEECGDIEIDDLRYISSHRIVDWRYEKETDKIMTALYIAKYVYGQIKPGDDVTECKWVNYKKFNFMKHLVYEHKPLWRKLFSNNRIRSVYKDYLVPSVSKT